MSKLLLVRHLFKRMNIKLNVEIDRSLAPVMVIGGLTPTWKIYKYKKYYVLVNVKWSGKSFKETKGNRHKNFKTCIILILLEEINQEYQELTKLFNNKRRLR